MKTNIRNILGGLSAAILLSACGIFPQESMYADYSAPPLKYNKNSAASKLIGSIRKTNANPDGMIDNKCFIKSTATANPTDCQLQRDAALLTLLTESDNLCQKHLKTIFGNDAAFNISTGTVTNLTSGAATVFGGATTKSALSAVAFFSNAERSLVNETVYKNMLVTAVTKKINDTRSEKRSAITLKFDTGIDEYSVLESVSDVIDYHRVCSFMHGLQKALDEGTQTTPATKKARLDQEKRDLESYIQNRKNVLGRSAASDKGIDGAKKRIEAIDEVLVNMIKAQE
uniref:Lipoprotein n=1 Tax=Candidatus Kentrum sp. TC TaxID=2126339 RepID=A0A450Z495_9GAMM|nr:MAG: hypothetical protein BECKTC1821D_GA0114238_10626 [Candidatus Kentron sp. TC]